MKPAIVDEKKKPARRLRKGILKGGVAVDGPPPRLNRWDHGACEEVDDAVPVLICPSCFVVYRDDPTVREAVCEECERSLRRYACTFNPEGPQP